jgi:hypothetical protein
MGPQEMEAVRKLGTRGMILRVTAKLGKKINAAPCAALPADPNPYADWTAHLFIADRTHYVLLSNTASLYSMVMYGRGMADGGAFLDRITRYMVEFMQEDDLAFICERLVIPSLAQVTFAKTLNRGVTGSMNDLVFQARFFLTQRAMSPWDVSFRLNEVPMSYLHHSRPRDQFTHLIPDAGR